jgi:hypothetical protein
LKRIRQRDTDRCGKRYADLYSGLLLRNVGIPLKQSGTFGHVTNTRDQSLPRAHGWASGKVCRLIQIAFNGIIDTACFGRWSELAYRLFLCCAEAVRMARRLIAAVVEERTRLGSTIASGRNALVCFLRNALNCDKEWAQLVLCCGKEVAAAPRED